MGDFDIARPWLITESGAIVIHRLPNARLQYLIANN